MANILIVDDDPNNCSLLKQNLEKCKHTTISCYSGLDACKEAKKSVFDLVFMDIHMPGIDGLETIKRLRAQGFSGKIIVVTADPSSANARQSIKVGGNGFLAKPIQVDICEVAKQFLS
ncbi:MAG: response regulator [Magnetococcales bacterium]|nr:response regulator [Magnetococcales bacterium]